MRQQKGGNPWQRQGLHLRTHSRSVALPVPALFPAACPSPSSPTSMGCLAGSVAQMTGFG